MNFVVLSSSRGTTFQAVLDAIADGSLSAVCIGLITDKADAGCITKAEAATIPVTILEKKEGESREEYDQRLDEAVRAFGTPDVLCALGWMRIVSGEFAKKWKIINVHPALLPKYGGKGMYGSHVHEAVIAHHDKESGITIHMMDEGVDTGPILLQKTCDVLSDDTPQTLQARVQELEKEWYPKVLQMIEEGEIVIEQ